METNLLFRSSQPATYLSIRLGWSLLPKRRYSSILAKNLVVCNTLGTMCFRGIFCGSICTRRSGTALRVLPPIFVHLKYVYKLTTLCLYNIEPKSHPSIKKTPQSIAKFHLFTITHIILIQFYSISLYCPVEFWSDVFECRFT